MKPKTAKVFQLRVGHVLFIHWVLENKRKHLIDTSVKRLNYCLSSNKYYEGSDRDLLSHFRDKWISEYTIPKKIKR